MIEGNIAKMIEGPRSISDHWISFKIPERMRAVRSEYRQEER
jgi:hypothetical protein